MDFTAVLNRLCHHLRCQTIKRRGYYTRSVLCDAVKQVMLGAMTVTQASRHYKIPRTTIQKHFSKAREQHNLKEMYIRRMEAAEKGLMGRVSSGEGRLYQSSRPICEPEAMRKPNPAADVTSFQSRSSKAAVKPLTRVVLRREGSEEVVKVVVIPRLPSAP
ncbi:helix-turn-helix protein [Cooperia oncophora]